MRILNLFIILALLWTFISSQTIRWINDQYIRVSKIFHNVDRYNVIVNQYCGVSCQFTGFTVPISHGKLKTKTLLSISGLNFVNNGASLGLRLKVYNLTDVQYNFGVETLNETVIYSLNVDAMTMHFNIPDYYSEYGGTKLINKEFNCKVLNQGQGYRSQNYSIPIQTNRPYYNFQAGGISTSVYPVSYVVFNPTGAYLYMNWKVFLNRTHYTIMFETHQKNIISTIGFNLLSLDLIYVRNNNYDRILSTGVLQCPGASCLGTGNWYGGVRYADEDRHFWGMSGFNFTKNKPINWYLNTSSVNNFSIGYIHSQGIYSISISGFIIAYRQCIDFDPVLQQYFDPSNLQCKIACTVSPYIYKNDAANLCARCHYTCNTCNNYTSKSCTSCSSVNQRYNASSGVFRCFCKPGYLDVGSADCRRCSNYMIGCNNCTVFNKCQTCNAGLQLSSDQNGCECIDKSMELTRSGQCIEIKGCLRYINGTTGQKLCIQCDIGRNFYLSSFKCKCVLGSQLSWDPINLTFFCKQSCGDKILTQSQQCDDGNTQPDDGCDSSCVVEQDYLCFSNYTDASFCLKNYAIVTHYEVLKNIGQQNTVEIYFSFKPWDAKIFQHIDVFQKLIHCSLEDKSEKYTDFSYSFEDYQQSEIRVKLSLKYKQKVDANELQNIRFEIKDNFGVNSIKAETNFTMQSKNYPLYMDSLHKSTYQLFSYILLVCIILGYGIVFISVFIQSWIGIQLMLTYQWLFFYLFLFKQIDGNLAQFVDRMKLAVGFSRSVISFSPYEYFAYNDKFFRLGYGKYFITNFNYTVIVFCLPVLMLLVRKMISCKKSSPQRSAVIKAKIAKGKKKPQAKKNSPLMQMLTLDKIFSIELILGRLSLSIILINILQSVISFYIQASSEVTTDTTFNQSAYSLYMYSILSLQMGFIAWIYIQTCQKLIFDNDQIPTTQRKIFLSPNFKPLYPLAYIVLQLGKFTYLILQFEQSSTIIVIIGLELLSLLMYAVYRPYTKENRSQQPKGYFLHNFHNVLNSIGLIGFLGLIYFTNQKTQDQIQSFSSIIVFYIITLCLCSMTLAIMRLLVTVQAFNGCLKNQKQSGKQTYSQIQITQKESKNPLKQLKTEQKTIQKQRKRKNLANLDKFKRKQLPFIEIPKKLEIDEDDFSKIENKIGYNLSKKQKLSPLLSEKKRATKRNLQF